MGEEVRNKQIILKHYVNGFPKESDMILETSIVKLKVPDDDGCDGAVLVKNLYLSCDPYMRTCMSKMEDNYIDSFTPGEVSDLSMLLMGFFGISFSYLFCFHGFS